MGEGSSEQEGTERGVGFIEGMCGRAEVGGRKVEDQRRDVINSRKKIFTPYNPFEYFISINKHLNN